MRVGFFAQGKCLIGSAEDERQAALHLEDDIWIYNFDNRILSPLTLDESINEDPIWIDDRTIAFDSNRDGMFNLYQKSLGSDEAVALLSPQSSTNRFMKQVHQGKAVFLQQSAGRRQIATLILGENTEPEILVDSPNVVESPLISPDGEWLSYNSDRSRRQEVYVRPLAGGDAVQVSRDGGFQARWKGDSSELVFRGLDGSLHAVAVNEGEFGEPRHLFQSGVTSLPFAHQYAMTADGERFLLLREVSEPSLTVILDWTAELEQ